MIMRIIISIIINIIITEVEITQCYCQQSFICSVIFNDKPVEKVQGQGLLTPVRLILVCQMFLLPYTP